MIIITIIINFIGLSNKFLLGSLVIGHNNNNTNTTTTTTNNNDDDNNNNNNSNSLKPYMIIVYSTEVFQITIVLKSLKREAKCSLQK